MTEVTVDEEKLEVASSFCYLADCLSSSGGCELATITRCRVAYSMSSCLFSPPLFSYHLQRKSLQFVRHECHAPCKRILAPTLSDLHCLQRNDRDMICWMRGVTTKDQVSPHHLLKRMQLDDLAKVLRIRQLRWHDHVERSESPETQSHKRSRPWPPHENLDGSDRHGPPSAGSNWDQPIQQ